jgi:hypothetical protein
MRIARAVGAVTSITCDSSISVLEELVYVAGEPSKPIRRSTTRRNRGFAGWCNCDIGYERLRGGTDVTARAAGKRVEQRLF